MLATDVEKMIRELHHGINQKRIALQCECDNLETVYVAIGQDDCLSVTDDHRTFQYLSESGNQSYVDIKDLDLAEVRQTCLVFGAQFKDAPQDGYPSIETYILADEPIENAVKRVADAIDAVFKLAQSI